MSKKVYLVAHLSSWELEQRYKKSRNPVESRRWHLLWKIAQDWTLKDSALAVGLCYGYAQRIVQKYNQKGEEGVKLKPRNRVNHCGGKKALLTSKQLQRLTQAMEEKPSDGGIWTGVKVARWMEKETGREKVWNQRGWDYLKKCGYSWQRPRPKHRKGNEREQAEFKQNLPLLVKQLQKKHADQEIEVWFLGARSLASYADAGTDSVSTSFPHRFLMNIE